MKLRATFGLDFDALPLEGHRVELDRICSNLESFFQAHHPHPFLIDLQISRATGILELDFLTSAPEHLQVVGSFFPRLDVYRWVNISKEL